MIIKQPKNAKSRKLSKSVESITYIIKVEIKQVIPVF